MKTTAIVSQVGGTGKTTLAIALAVELVKMGRKTCLVDLDFGGSQMLKMTCIQPPSTAQSNRLISLANSPTERSTRLWPEPLAMYHGAYILPCSMDPVLRYRSTSEEQVGGDLEFIWLIRDLLQRIGKFRFDHVLLDTPPGDDWLGRAAIRAIKQGDNVTWCTRQGVAETSSSFYVSGRDIQQRRCMVVNPNHVGVLSVEQTDLVFTGSQGDLTGVFRYTEARRPLITSPPSANNPAEQQFLESIAQWTDEH